MTFGESLYNRSFIMKENVLCDIAVRLKFI